MNGNGRSTITLDTIQQAAIKYLHVYGASVSVRKDCSGESITLSIRRNRGDCWETITRQPSRFHLLAWVNSHDPGTVSAVESGRNISSGNVNWDA